MFTYNIVCLVLAVELLKKTPLDSSELLLLHNEAMGGFFYEEHNVRTTPPKYIITQ